MYNEIEKTYYVEIVNTSRKFAQYWGSHVNLIGESHTSDLLKNV